MAASDQTYRSQKALHVVFAVSSVAMLATTVWMFWDDYNRAFKKEQRIFRTVEEELAKRDLLATAPDAQRREEVIQAAQALADARTAHNAVRQQADDLLKRHQTDLFKAEKRYADLKADFDSLMSYYNIEVEHHDPTTATAKQLLERMEAKQKQMAELKLAIENTQTEINNVGKTKLKVGNVELTPEEAAANLSKAEDEHKRKTEEFDRFLKLVDQKRWGWGDAIRKLPVIDGFASPVKIEQYTLDELPIDYSFKYATRYDRCTTCHLGMEKASYTKAALRELANDPHANSQLMASLKNAEATIEARNRIIAEYNSKAPRADRKDPLPLGVSHLQPQQVDLSAARVNMFAAHPRLDLFVDSNSPHPVEKFGCSICHGGQGSATTFVDAVHSPNDPLIRERWRKEHNWASIHFWDYPMQPQRFAESTCLKCHHQVYDLIRDTTKVEAPKLLQGFNLVRELGCFGCHEIAGQKSNRWVGPDLRLEPDPPLDALSPEERTKRLSDPANPPGTMRKVGPSLARIAEKTNEDWARQWIKSPRDFRPDTRMPHYYGQPNNVSDALKDTARTTGIDQTRFPDAEIDSIAHYLFQTSRNQLREISERSKDGDEARQADAKAVEDLIAKLADTKLGEAEKRSLSRQLAAVKARIAARSQPRPADDAVQLPPVPADDKARADQSARGRHLFSTRGCLACHQHSGTAQDGQYDGKPTPPIIGDSNFGPNLSRLTAKIGTKAGDPQSGRKWLVQWLLNPAIHSTRTLMPSVQLTEADADDIAAWLLSQPSDWKGVPVEKSDTATLKSLARVWLVKTGLTNRELDNILDKGNGFSAEELANKPADADEHLLGGAIDDGKLKMYVGKRAINNLGCFGCHNIAGFENTKPIGTPLNEWGKKDPDRLAFEDSEHFLREHFHIVDARRELTEDEKGRGAIPWEFKGDKPPYERFFFEALEHHQRDGFLHLKLQEPRSYDHNRIRMWEDRLRMPQFKFSRTKQQPGESDDAFKLRVSKEEAEGREAVMTFILGLIAEPIPAKYVHTPSGDRQAEVKGRAVLEKFNCAGCHLLAPGTFEFKLNNTVYREKEEEKDGQKVKTRVTLRDAVLGKLDAKHNDYRNDANQYGRIFGSYDTAGPTGVDHRFPGHNAWTGPPPPKDKVILRGMYPEVLDDDEDMTKKNLIIRLTYALRFLGADSVLKDLPAFIEVILPQAALDSTRTRPAFGGTFAEALHEYLAKHDGMKYGDDKSRASAPPPLIREGEKVQSGWLFQFLKNPQPLRPMTVLRMPRFSLSDDDAMALVNYFAAVDRVQNPGIGLTYPYFPVPQREAGYIEKMTAEYVARLKRANTFDARVREFQPVWAAMIRDQVADAEAALKEAQARLNEAKQKQGDVATAEKVATDAEQTLKRLRQKLEASDFKDLQQEWERREAYVVDAFRLITHPDLCLKCHSVGTIKAQEQQGPPLNLAAERIRPDWALRWISNPQRFLHYKSVMPINFPANAESNPYAGAFVGSEKGFTDEQIQACRDFLMIYSQVADWPVLKHRPAPGATGGK